MDTAINGTVTVRAARPIEFNKTFIFHSIRPLSPAVENTPIGESYSYSNPETFWRTGNKLEDLRCLVDAAYSRVELMDVSKSPYNKRWKAAWLKRARELGATPEW